MISLAAFAPEAPVKPFPGWVPLLQRKQAFHRRLIARPIQNRAHGENLVERQFAVENVAAGKAVS